MAPETSTNMVRKYRRWQEMSQAELAQRAGVSRQTIANIEKGNYAPSVYLALATCRVLGRTVEEIFSPDEEEQ